MELADICRLVEECFELPNGSVNENMKSTDIGDWDSLGHFALLEFMEGKFPTVLDRYPGLAQSSSIHELYALGLKDI